MGSHRTISSSSFPTPAPPSPPPDLLVVGTGVPSPNGDYYEDGLYDEEMSYRRSDNQYYVWYDYPSDFYWITTEKGDQTISWRCQEHYTLIGLYDAFNGVTGESETVLP